MTERHGQLNFEGTTKPEIAVERLRQFEPPEGYYLAFSGGKDSVTVLALAKQAGVKFDAHYHTTTVDPPELVRFVRSVDGVTIEKAPATMWAGIQTNGMPTRLHRWCCRALKEYGGSGRVIITGVRRAEGKGKTRRANRQMVEACYTDSSKRFVNPIVDWIDNEVWGFIEASGLETCSLYREGFTRIGCVLCPMNRDVAAHIARWPKIAASYRRACDRYYAKGTKSAQRYASADALWHWWIDRDASAPDAAQAVMFE